MGRTSLCMAKALLATVIFAVWMTGHTGVDSERSAGNPSATFNEGVWCHLNSTLPLLLRNVISTKTRSSERSCFKKFLHRIKEFTRNGVPVVIIPCIFRDYSSFKPQFIFIFQSFRNRNFQQFCLGDYVFQKSSF